MQQVTGSQGSCEQGTHEHLCVEKVLSCMNGPWTWLVWTSHYYYHTEILQLLSYGRLVLTKLRIYLLTHKRYSKAS